MAELWTGYGGRMIEVLGTGELGASETCIGQMWHPNGVPNNP